MNRRLFAAYLAALPAAGTVVFGSAAQSATPSMESSRDAPFLLSEYLYRVVNQGDMAAIDDLFDRESVNLEEVRAFHGEEISQLALIGQRPSSQLYVTCAGGAYAMAQGVRSGVNVFYILQESGGSISQLSISTIEDATLF